MAYTPSPEEIMANLAPPPDAEQRLSALLDRLENVTAIEQRLSALLDRLENVTAIEPKLKTTPAK
jgi:hypothetical protein